MEHSNEQFWYKLMMNSWYPIIGHANFIFYDPQVAKRVTSTGNTILNSIMHNDTNN